MPLTFFESFAEKSQCFLVAQSSAARKEELSWRVKLGWVKGSQVQRFRLSVGYVVGWICYRGDVLDKSFGGSERRKALGFFTSPRRGFESLHDPQRYSDDQKTFCWLHCQQAGLDRMRTPMDHRLLTEVGLRSEPTSGQWTALQYALVWHAQTKQTTELGMCWETSRVCSRWGIKTIKVRLFPSRIYKKTPGGTVQQYQSSHGQWGLIVHA